MKLNQDFKEFIKLLNSHNVKYLLVGGWSVALHGRPRYTKDIDFYIFASEENSKKMMRVIKDFGFGSLDLSESDFAAEEQIIQLGVEPHRIDLIMSLKGIDFNAAWSRKVVVEIDGISVNLISAEDLIQAKLAAGRPQDLADAALLKKIHQTD